MAPMRLFDRPSARRLRVALILTSVTAIVLLVFLVARSRGEKASVPAVASSPEAAATALPALTEGQLPARPVDPPKKAWFVDQSAPPIELSGHVFLDGHPASGVTVTASDELTTDGLLPPLKAVSDREGRFVFASVPRIRGWYRLAAPTPGVAPAWANVPGDMPKNDIELRQETCRMHVYGVVSDASGGAVAAAKVFLEKVPEHFVVSGAGGQFQLCAAPRTGRLRVEADGYGPWLHWVSPRGALRQDVTLVPAASIVGTVVFTRGGAAAPFALVSVRASGESIRDVQADGEGHFEIPNVAPGSYAVEARTSGARSQHPVTVAAFASAKASVTVPIDTRARVHGRVVSAAGPIARNGINLGFSATFEWGTAVRTGEDGSFTIEDAPIGNVFVKVDDHDVEAPKTLRVPEGGLADVTVRVLPRAQVLVTVTRQGAPVSDATVFLRGTNASDTKSTNAAGIATFRGLGETTYRVFTEHENDFAVLERVDVSRDIPTKITLELTAGRQIAGKVVDEQGRPVDGARVSFALASTTEDGGASAITGADGSFRGGPLRGPATYQVKLARSGFALDAKGELPRLTVPESGPVTPANLVLVVKTQDKDLAGHVVDPAEGPIRDARVTVSRPERHADVLATTFTGNDGSFAFHGLGAGPWAVKAVAASGSEAEVKPVTLPSRELRIELPPVGTIRGTVKGFARTPSVMAWSVVGYDWDFHPAVVESGRFTITGLSRGRYHVAASSTEGAAQTTVDVVDVVDVELASSGKRTLHGKTLDFASGRPLSNMSCQAAPYIEGARSPVVVPGNIFSNEEGAFDLVDVPASDLYMWCTSDSAFRGGVARMPSNLGDKLVTVWGLDVRGQKALDVKTLGLTMADDHPFSRQIAVIEPKGNAERAGLRVGDVFESVGEKPLAEVGNGIVRNYLALLLTTHKSVPIAVTRSGTVVPLHFALH
jgi:Carboxypeptidase regulatory-like domain